MSIKISIALCTYNGARYLKDQLDSIGFQLRPPDELIICDDNSTDETVSIAKAFANIAKFPVMLIINDNNLGTVKNFEKAISFCKGDIIVLSDQDDIWYPHKLQQIEMVFQNNTDIGAVFSDADIVDEKLNSMGYTLWQTIRFSERERELVRRGCAFNVLLRHNIVAGATMAFNSSYKKYVLPFPSMCMHDAWISLIISSMSNIEMIPEPLIKYRQHGDQQVGAGRNLNLVDDIWEIFSGICKYKKFCIPNYKAYIGYEISMYKALEERLSTIDYVTDDKRLKLRAKIEHLEARSRMAQMNKIKRIPLALKELLTLHYDKYSNGLLYFLEDLLL